jgi:hypothetical protein
VSRAHYMGGSVLRNLFHVCRSRAIPSSNWVFSRHSFALWIVCGEDGFTLLKVQRKLAGIMFSTAAVWVSVFPLTILDEFGQANGAELFKIRFGSGLYNRFVHSQSAAS